MTRYYCDSCGERIEYANETDSSTVVVVPGPPWERNQIGYTTSLVCKGCANRIAADARRRAEP